MSLLVLTGYALLTALATGLGAVPFAFTRRVTPRWGAWAALAAAGLMVATSAGLLREGAAYGAVATAGGVALGALLVRLSHAWADGRGDVGAWDLHGADARRALVVFGVMLAHSFTEGVGLGVSFGGGEGLGGAVTLALAVHNVPEGLAIALTLVPQGVSWRRAAALAVASSLPQPLMAVPAYLFVETFRLLLPLGLGFAAGAMVWLALTDLVPDAARTLRTTPADEPAA